MQNREYTQIYEMGLGSLIGDFFENVKDTVTGVARAVAPIAPVTAGRIFLNIFTPVGCVPLQIHLELLHEHLF